MKESIDRAESIPAFLVEAVEAAYGADAVSYTHLDVYKRQVRHLTFSLHMG